MKHIPTSALSHRSLFQQVASSFPPLLFGSVEIWKLPTKSQMLKEVFFLQLGGVKRMNINLTMEMEIA